MLDSFLSVPVAAILRWIAFSAASVVGGAAMYRAMEKGQLDPTLAQGLHQLVRVCCGALLLTGIGRMAQQAFAFAPEPSQAWPMVATLLGTAWGFAWSVQILAAVGLFIVPGLSVRWDTLWRRLVSGVLVTAIVATPAFQGHAIGSAEFTVLAVVADVMHLAGAAAWIGTLFVLAVVILAGRDGASAARIVRTFSPYALLSAATLGATGLFASWLHVRHLPLMWTSAYGRVLCLKLVLVAGVAALGAINWKRITPLLSRPGGVTPLLRTARVELALATALLAATAVLVATPLPNE